MDKKKADLQQQLKENNILVYAIGFEYMTNQLTFESPALRALWRKIEAKAEFAANYYATFDDLNTIGKILQDVGMRGILGIKVQNYNGKPYIIFKGYAGKRSFFTGTRYGISNTKVVTMALGAQNAVGAIKSGAVVTFVLCSAFRVVQYLTDDEKTLAWLLGSIFSDGVKVAIATGAAYAASAIAGALFTFAIGPIAAAVFVGVITSIALGELDKKYGLTDKLLVKLNNVQSSIENIPNSIVDSIKDKALALACDVAEYIYDETGRLVEKKIYSTLRELIESRVRLY
ncbi:MAG TPA: hypothetical protein DHW71_13240 [Gammaproteobacteria bacterium]|nr:hypothetical protein [Gammaproteobacteria bacterium]MEC8010523.1 hypothetical protein [Pseudomonadota bacterium]HBF09399.1 hypothetical protein [Gammaproteobacteria bacterium]HCK93954.1 hypothetical protein [Gammaproteobacteria bacterium]|tara:strand:- start:1509 stop:2369 length:861 start_codon:yes stop_codon:yes gene_type:complete